MRRFLTVHVKLFNLFLFPPPAPPPQQSTIFISPSFLPLILPFVISAFYPQWFSLISNLFLSQLPPLPPHWFHVYRLDLPHLCILLFLSIAPTSLTSICEWQVKQWLPCFLAEEMVFCLSVHSPVCLPLCASVSLIQAAFSVATHDRSNYLLISISSERTLTFGRVRSHWTHEHLHRCVLPFASRAPLWFGLTDS